MLLISPFSGHLLDRGSKSRSIWYLLYCMRLNWTQNHAGGVFLAAPRGGHVSRMRACTGLALPRFYLRSTRVSAKLRTHMYTSAMDQDVERVYRSLHPQGTGQQWPQARQGLAERLRNMASYLESGGGQTILGDMELDGSAAGGSFEERLACVNVVDGQLGHER